MAYIPSYPGAVGGGCGNLAQHLSPEGPMAMILFFLFLSLRWKLRHRVTMSPSQGGLAKAVDIRKCVILSRPKVVWGDY